jgi:hypothetical protein
MPYDWSPEVVVDSVDFALSLKRPLRATHVCCVREIWQKINMTSHFTSDAATRSICKFSAIATRYYGSSHRWWIFRGGDGIRTPKPRIVIDVCAGSHKYAAFVSAFVRLAGKLYLINCNSRAVGVASTKNKKSNFLEPWRKLIINFDIIFTDYDSSFFPKLRSADASCIVNDCRSWRGDSFRP